MAESLHDAARTGDAHPGTLPITGELSIYNVAELKQSCLEALRASPSLRLDLSEVTVMDGAGLQLLIMLKREAQVLGKELALTRHSEAVLKVLDLSNMAGYFGDPLILGAETTH